MYVFGPKSYNSLGVNQFEVFFSKMVKYDPLVAKWYKVNDFESIMIMSNFGMASLF